MLAFVSLWLLAAYFSVVIAGPLPLVRHEKSPRYANASSPASTSVTYSSSSTFIGLWYEVPKSRQSVEAKTAVVVEPVDRTVFTRTEAAITFVNPKGDPVATQPEEIILSTSFLTASGSSETPAPKASPKASGTPAYETLTEHLGRSGRPSEQATPSSSEPLAANTTGEANKQKPVFTYAPDSDATSSALSTETTSAGSATPVEGFNSSLPQFIQSSSASAIATSPVTPLQSTLSVPSVPASQSPKPPVAEPTFPPSTVVVTLTEYTTVYPSSAIPTEPVVPVSSSDLLSSANSSAAAIPTLTRQQPRPGLPSVPPNAGETPASSAPVSSIPASPAAPSSAPSSSAPAEAPQSSLPLPPVVVISSSVAISSESLASSTPASAPSEIPAASSSAAVKPPSNGGFGGGFNYPTRPAGSPDSPTESTPPSSSDTAPPSSSAPPPESKTPPAATPAPPEASPPPPPPASPSPSPSPPEASPAPPAASSAPPAESPKPPAASAPAPGPPPPATTGGPLLVVPIDSSQIFTVTETITEKVTEKETVTVTATVPA